MPRHALSVRVVEEMWRYTRLKKRCRVKSINDAQCDTVELWEDDRGKFVAEFRFLLFKIFYFQDNLKSRVRHAVLLQCAHDQEWRQEFTLPRAPLGRIVTDLCFSPDNVFSIGCI